MVGKVKMPEGSQGQQAKPKLQVKNDDDLLIELIEQLQKIDTEKPLAKLNQVTITDNNGSRIYLW